MPVHSKKSLCSLCFCLSELSCGADTGHSTSYVEHTNCVVLNDAFPLSLGPVRLPASTSQGLLLEAGVSAQQGRQDGSTHVACCCMTAGGSGWPCRSFAQALQMLSIL